jgi:hypothetical protein
MSFNALSWITSGLSGSSSESLELWEAGGQLGRNAALYCAGLAIIVLSYIFARRSIGWRRAFRTGPSNVSTVGTVDILVVSLLRDEKEHLRRAPLQKLDKPTKS